MDKINGQLVVPQPRGNGNGGFAPPSPRGAQLAQARNEHRRHDAGWGAAHGGGFAPQRQAQPQAQQPFAPQQTQQAQQLNNMFASARGVAPAVPQVPIKKALMSMQQLYMHEKTEAARAPPAQPANDPDAME